MRFAARRLRDIRVFEAAANKWLYASQNEIVLPLVLGRFIQVAFQLFRQAVVTQRAHASIIPFDLIGHTGLACDLLYATPGEVTDCGSSQGADRTAGCAAQKYTDTAAKYFTHPIVRAGAYDFGCVSHWGQQYEAKQ